MYPSYLLYANTVQNTLHTLQYILNQPLSLNHGNMKSSYRSSYGEPGGETNIVHQLVDVAGEGVRSGTGQGVSHGGEQANNDFGG